MPLTMAIRQAPMVWKIDLIFDVLNKVSKIVVVGERRREERGEEEETGKCCVKVPSVSALLEYSKPLHVVIFEDCLDVRVVLSVGLEFFVRVEV